MASFFESAVQKTKDMTDIARINSLISDEEKKINGVYTQLGKFYATLHANDYETQFAGMMIAIKEAEMNISLYKKQILDIKVLQFAKNVVQKLQRAFYSAMFVVLKCQKQSLTIFQTQQDAQVVVLWFQKTFVSVLTVASQWQL